MKIELSVAVAFLVSLGFAKASEWDETKIKDRLRQTPERIEEKKIAPEFQGVYKELGALSPEDKIELVKDAVTEPKKPAKKPATAPAKESAKKPAAAPAKEPAKRPAKKPAKKPAAEALTPPNAKRGPAETDEYGSRPGTVRAKVNAALGVDWKTDEEIAVEAGITVKQARIRLRRAKKTGLVQARRLFQYKWVREN